MGHRYIDFDLIRKYPNKYELTPKSIRKLVILDWDRLKTKTWHNDAMKNSGSWWCHLEGCEKEGQKFNDDSEFWIGFREGDNKVKCNFTCYEGMCKYEFKKFYDVSEIENQYDMQVQVNAIKWLTNMIDEGILGIQNSLEEKE